MKNLDLDDTELIAEKAKLEAKRARIVAAITELGAGAEQQAKRDKLQGDAGAARDRIRAINVELHTRAKSRADARRGVRAVASPGPLHERIRVGCEGLVELIDEAPSAIAPTFKTLRKKLLEIAAALEKPDNVAAWEKQG